jgi:hypothetical protein
MAFMKEIVAKMMSDPRYQKNIEYGEPRSGHPEGKVKYHIADMEENLEKLRPHGISEEEYWKLKFLIHVHDTFKAESIPDSPIVSLNSHASLAKKFASEFTQDEDLLNMIQFHDVNFNDLLETIKDWELFLMFIILDGSTQGKDPKKTGWFINEVRKYKDTRVDETWLL